MLSFMSVCCLFSPQALLLTNLSTYTVSTGRIVLFLLIHVFASSVASFPRVLIPDSNVKTLFTLTKRHSLFYFPPGSRPLLVACVNLPSLLIFLFSPASARSPPLHPTARTKTARLPKPPTPPCCRSSPSQASTPTPAPRAPQGGFCSTAASSTSPGRGGSSMSPSLPLFHAVAAASSTGTGPSAPSSRKPTVRL